MVHAVLMAKLTSPARVDWALGHAAVHQLGEHDLASILTSNPTTAPARRADETQSLAGAPAVGQRWPLPARTDPKIRAG